MAGCEILRGRWPITSRKITEDSKHYTEVVTILKQISDHTTAEANASIEPKQTTIA